MNISIVTSLKNTAPIDGDTLGLHNSDENRFGNNFLLN